MARVYGNYIKGCEIGVSLPDGSDTHVFGNDIQQTGIAVEIRDAVPQPVIRQILAAIEGGRSEDEIRQEFDEPLRQAGTSFDVWLARAGNLAGLGSLLAQVLLGS